jgi:methylmalonyl-CoA/ethylmalonyl-CoA epimerase
MTDLHPDPEEHPIATGSGIAVTAIDHVGIAVPDLAAAIAFHTTVLGGTLTHRERNDEQGVEEAMIGYGNGAQVQLLAPLTAESTIAGVRTLYDEPRRGTNGSSINFLHPKDAGGVLVELVEPAG